jgi:aminoglycoside phosphotransferase family enzyme
MEGTGHAEVRETHAAVVFFIGDMAYKLKKPVDLGFLDFHSRQVREAVCHREAHRVATDETGYDMRAVALIRTFDMPPQG